MTPYAIVSLWDMLQLPLGKLLASAHHLTGYSQAIALNPNQDMKMDDAGYAVLRDASVEFVACCSEIGLSVSGAIGEQASAQILSVSKVGALWVITAQQARVLGSTLKALSVCLKTEASLKVAMILSPENAKLFEQNDPPFGADVEAKFPALSYDATEGAKCLGLGRSTASAFHFIRCLEGGIRALSRCLSIPDPTTGGQRNWGQMLKNVKDAYEAKWPSSGDRFSGDGKLFEEVHGALSGMQNPYRNATMHLDHKYTQEEAEQIMAIVKGLMVKIASRMDENGQPLA